MTSIAVLLTCFNRRDLTLECLRFVTAQASHDVDLSFFLVDDGSTDGTGDAVRDEFPEVKVILGNGSLFWNRGMCKAWTAALDAGPFDLYLLLNDDTILDENAFEILLSSHAQARDGVIVGTVCDSETGKTTYGGYVPGSRWNRFKINVREPGDPTECVTMNANCVLVPASVVERVGTLDPVFHHTFGDIDYGYRVGKAGLRVVSTDVYVGTCSFHSGTHGYTDPGMTLRERVKFMRGIRGLNGKDWRVLTFRHGGFFAPVVWVSPYLNMVRTHLMEKRGR